jgi:RHS repeat-associated protein
VYDDAGRLVAETDGAGGGSEYVYLGDIPVAMARTVMQGGVPVTTLYYVHADHLNTPRMLTTADANGTVVWRWDSEPFGSTLANADPDQDGQPIAFNLRFPGQYFDAETQLHYNYFRDYEPSLGRYVQSDPIGLAGGLNTYAYVSNNPLSLVDPSGKVGVLAAPLAIGLGACLRVPACARALGHAVGVVITTGAGWWAAQQNESESTSGTGSDAAGANGGTQCPANGENTNPYQGPVTQPVIVVDQNGNAIPVNEGEQITSSPNGDYQQVRDGEGNANGVRLDRGGHRTHANPNAQGPHGHVPGVTRPNGDPHLPIN